MNNTGHRYNTPHHINAILHGKRSDQVRVRLFMDYRPWTRYSQFQIRCHATLIENDYEEIWTVDKLNDIDKAQRRLARLQAEESERMSKISLW